MPGIQAEFGILLGWNPGNNRDGMMSNFMEAMSHEQFNQMIYEAERQLTQLRIENWLNLDLFSWQWWILLVLLFLPWLVWWKYVDKQRLQEIFIVGLLVLILSAHLDAVFSETGLWYYHYWLTPWTPHLVTANFSFIPVVYMLVYQRYRSWSSYLAAMAVLALVLAVPIEMILVWTDIFEIRHWRSCYGIPIFFGMGVLVRWLTQTMMNKQAQAL